MSETRPSIHANVYHNTLSGAAPNAFMPNPDVIDQAFIEKANRVLSAAVESIRVLIGAHQSAIAIIVQRDWQAVHKFFSLSEKYAAWADYRTPAKGVGIHAWMLEYNQPIRLTQAELEAHPAWLGFGSEAGRHPPMRGWLAAPLVDRNGTNWGLLQLSDKYEEDFTVEDEKQFVAFAGLVSTHLEALWDLRNSRKQQQTKQPKGRREE
jgi:GAF domain-containing protein